MLVEKELEAEVGIEGRPPSALLLWAQFRPDNIWLGDTWQDRPSSALPTPFQRSFTEEFTEGRSQLDDRATAGARRLVGDWRLAVWLTISGG